ncbi:hypothetical protein A4274_09370 [Campylobacter coli]|nr:hypothetical protein [Campylobacter coli]
MEKDFTCLSTPRSITSPKNKNIIQNIKHITPISLVYIGTIKINDKKSDVTTASTQVISKKK